MNILSLFISVYPYASTKPMIVFRLALFFVLLIILTTFFIYFLYKTKKEEKKNQLKTPLTKFYLSAFLGLICIALNAFISSFYLYYTNGKYILFGYQNAIIYNFGNLLLIVSLVQIMKNLVYFNSLLLKTLNLLYILGIATAVVGQIFVIADIFGFAGFVNIQITTILALGGILFMLVMIGASIGLFQQLKYNASPLEKLRLYCIIITFGILIFQLLARILTIFAVNNQNFFNMLTFFIYPLIDLLGYPIFCILLIWSIYTPLSLQIKMKIIPKEFAHLI